MAVFDQYFQHLMEVEGGYSNNSDDLGGETIYGISRRNHPEMWQNGLPSKEAAKTFYKVEYWDRMQLDAVAEFSPSLAGKLFDIGISQGLLMAGSFLQRLLNLLLPDHSLKLDGKLGPETLHALRSYYQYRGGVTLLVKGLNVLQGARYIEISESRPANRTFLYGWLSKRVQ